MLPRPSLLILPLAGAFSSLFITSSGENFTPLFLEGSEESGPFSVLIFMLPIALSVVLEALVDVDIDGNGGGSNDDDDDDDDDDADDGDNDGGGLTRR